MFKDFIEKFDYLRVLNSPFKPFKLKFYLGKTTIGVPYFLPRKWVKPGKKMARELALKEIEKCEERFKRNPRWHDIPTYETAYRNVITSKYPVPKKIGLDIVPLGWKTKWGEYRFEFEPKISFVFFGLQFVITVSVPHETHYWESWLYYDRQTDKTKSVQERIKQCREENPQTWIKHSKDGEVKTDYYDLILKNKHLKK